LKGDVYIHIDDNTKLVAEVKHYKEDFKTHYKQLYLSPGLIFNVTPEKDIIIAVMYLSEFIEVIKGKTISVMKPNIYQVKRNNFDIAMLDKNSKDTMRIQGRATNVTDHPVLIKRSNNHVWIISGYKENMESLFNGRVTYPDIMPRILNDQHVPKKYRPSK